MDSQTNTENTACFAQLCWPWWKRAVCKLFPAWHGFAPELPEWAKDGVVTITEVRFSIVDRLRILVTGNLSVKTWTACENLPGRVLTTSASAKPMAPKWCEPK